MNTTHTSGAPRRLVHLALVGLLPAILAPGRAAAQGSCSVPQAGPGSVQGQGVGSLAPGAGWVQGSVFSLGTSEQFGTTGNTEDYFAEGNLDLTSLLLTGAVGLVPGLEAWGQLSFHSLDFREVSGSRTRTGVGDARLWLRAGPRLLGIDENRLPVWVGLRAGIKLPGSSFPIDSQIIPLTEGQRDAEVAVELGRALGGGRFIVQGWGGYRWRGENTKADSRPGNEWFGYLAGSTSVGGLGLRVAAQLLRGAPYKSLGFAIPSSRRQMFELFPSIGRQLGSGQLEVGARVPVAGRNLPAGNALTFGYTIGFGGVDESVHPEDLFPKR
jgi:Putative MetA-pathway of phenol degradation